MYPSKEVRVAHTLWIAHTHLMDCWDSTLRLTFLSPEPGSGKSHGWEITVSLVPGPILAASVTPAYLFRRAAEEQVTLLVDEADTVFSVKSEGSEKIRAFLNASHRRGNSAGRCVGQGSNITPEDLPCFSASRLSSKPYAGNGHEPQLHRSHAAPCTYRNHFPVPSSQARARRQYASGSSLYVGGCCRGQHQAQVRQ